MNKILCLIRDLSVKEKKLVSAACLRLKIWNSHMYITTNDKITDNGIFDLKYIICYQKKFSLICINSTSVDVYNTNKSLI
jgi:hypothetical protein